MRRARNVALAAVVAGAMLGCTGPEITKTTPACNLTVGPRGDGPPDLEMQVGDTARVPLKDHFGPVDCLESWKSFKGDLGDRSYEGDLVGVFETGSSDSAAVAVSISGFDLKTVAIGVADSVRMTVWASPNHHMNTEPHEFLVRVGPAGR